MRIPSAKKLTAAAQPMKLSRAFAVTALRMPANDIIAISAKKKSRNTFPPFLMLPLLESFIVITVILYWSRWPDSNRRPGDYKSPALPAELHRRKITGYLSLFAIYMPPNRIGKANQEQTLPVTHHYGIEPQSPVYLRVF